MAKKQLTEVELRLERLENDQRILQQERERLEILREKEVAKREAERGARSGDVVEELGAATKLLVEQDGALEKQVKSLASLEKQKTAKLAEKEQLENSTQERVNALLQEQSDVRRSGIIGLERVEQEIHSQALESVVREKTEELSVQREQLQAKQAEHELQSKNIQALVDMDQPLVKLGKARQELAILEQAQEIRNKKKPFDKFLKYPEKQQEELHALIINEDIDEDELNERISKTNEFLKELENVQEKLDERHDAGERDQELITSIRSNQSAIAEGRKTLEQLEFVKTIRDDKDVSEDPSMEELLEGVQEAQQRFQEELDELNSQVEQGDQARVARLISDNDVNNTFEKEKEVDQLTVAIKAHPGYQYLSQKGAPDDEVIFHMASEQQLSAKDYSYESTLDGFVKSEKLSLRKKDAELHDLSWKVDDLEKELAKIKKAGKVELPPELVEELEQEKQRIRDSNARKKLALAEEVSSVDVDGRDQVETFAHEISSLDKTIRDQRGLVDRLERERDSTSLQISALEEEFNKLEASKKSKVVKSREQEVEERFYFPSKDPRAVKLRDTVAHRRELREQEQLLRKEFQQELTGLQVENERLRRAERAEIEAMDKERELFRGEIRSLKDQLQEKEDMVLPTSGVSLAEEFAQMEVEKLKLEVEQLRAEKGALELSASKPDQRIADLEKELAQAKQASEEALKLANEKSALEIAALKQQVQEKGDQVGLLEGQIKSKEAAIALQAEQGKLVLQGVQDELVAVKEQLGVAKSGSDQAVLLQSKLEELQQEKARIVEQNKLDAQEAQGKLEALELSKKEALLEQQKPAREMQVSIDSEVAILIDKLQISEKRVQDQQKVLDSMGDYLSELDDRIDSLESALLRAEQDIEGNVGDKAKLGKKVIQLEQEIAEAREERDDALGKKHKAEELLKEFHEFHEQELERREAVLEHPRHLVDKSEPKGHELPEEVHSVVTKIPDRVSTVSDDQMLKDFRDLREMQRDVIAATIKGAPKENEAFHKYASKEGAEIAKKLDPETSKLMADIEHEKYKEIHSKYPHSDIDWQGKNQVSINKNGVEICKLNSKPVTPSPAGYELDGQKIANYRSLELPLKAESGPMHMSLAVKDLQGDNISGKNAVYLTAHYDKQGKLVEMTAPIPVYYTDKGRESPVCIKRDGKTYTLPVNRGQYEDMLNQIEKNKGLQAELGVGKAPLGKKELLQDAMKIGASVSSHTVDKVQTRSITTTPTLPKGQTQGGGRSSLS